MTMKKRYRRRSDRYARRATRRTSSPTDPLRTKRVLAVALGAVAVVIVALVWGNILKARSDEYHANNPDVAWTLDEETASAAVPPPAFTDAAVMSPGGSVPTDYEAALLDLGSGDGDSPYASEVLSAAGIASAQGGADLADDIARVRAYGMTAAGVFTVTALSEDDPVMAAYRRGLELARLTECASAGLDELILMGIPTGDAVTDRVAVDYVTDLKKALADLEEVPAVTVVLPLSAYAVKAADGMWSYDRCLTPGRLLTAGDGLVLDLTSTEAEDMAEVLQGVQYPYVRYQLRLLIHADTPVPDETTGNGDTVTVQAWARAHGFTRVMAWKRPSVE